MTDSTDKSLKDPSIAFRMSPLKYKDNPIHCTTYERLVCKNDVAE